MWCRQGSKSYQVFYKTAESLLFLPPIGKVSTSNAVLRSWCKMGGVADSSDLNHCEEGSIPCFTWMLQSSVFQYDSLRVQVMQCGHRDTTAGAVLMVTHVGTCECYLTVAPSRAYCSDRT